MVDNDHDQCQCTGVDDTRCDAAVACEFSGVSSESKAVDIASAATSPVVLLALSIVVHVYGRLAAICHPYKVDSFTYAVAAHKFWHPGATFADLVSDKPVGQTLLTGWCYRLWPWEPSRLTLVPIESAFLLAAYAVFWRLACRISGRRVGAALTLFFVVAHNAYNALDFTTDGFNLNESYLALPMLLAAAAHMRVDAPVRRGLLSGLSLGVALTVKQSAVGLLAAVLAHEWVRMRWGHRSARQAAAACSLTLVGVAVACLPAALALVSFGWLGAHLRTLMDQTGTHAGPRAFARLRWYDISPLLPAWWFGVLGLVGWWRTRARGSVAEKVGHPHTSRAESPDNAEPGGDRAATSCDKGPGERDRFVAFLWLWLLAEVAILVVMRKPSSHYYQQIVAPVCLLAGVGAATLAHAVRTDTIAGRMMVWRWAGVTALLLTVVAVMPLFAAASRRLPTFRYAEEVRQFSVRLAPTEHLPHQTAPGDG